MEPPGGRTIKLRWLQKTLWRAYSVKLWFGTRVYKSQAATFCIVASTSCASSLWNLFSCRPSGALNFDAAARIMGNLCTTDVMDDVIGLSVDVWYTAGERRLLTEEVYRIFRLICWIFVVFHRNLHDMLKKRGRPGGGRWEGGAYGDCVGKNFY